MPRKSKADIIQDRELEMANAAFVIIQHLRSYRLHPLEDYEREAMLEAHFDLSYHFAIIENRVADIMANVVRQQQRRQIAQQPGPWPEGHFDQPATA